MSEEKKNFLEKTEKISFDKEHREKIKFNISRYYNAVEKGKTQYSNLELAKERASKIKQNVINNLENYLTEFEGNFNKNGGKLIWAQNKEEVIEKVKKIIEKHKVKSIVKSKSMTTEEIDFNESFKKEKVEILETDLGEYIVQLDNEKPYHIVTPAMHKSKEDVAELFNRKFNTQGERAFITTQSIKKLKAHLKDWALSTNGWKLPNDEKIYDISKLDTLLEIASPEEAIKIKNKVFFKEKWINENGLEQKLIITYSIKYRDYQRNIRYSQIERAKKTINSNPKKIEKHRQNDFKRFIEKTTCTKDGEIADKDFFNINLELIEKEQLFDGFYGVCTNLEDNASEIIKVNQRRWEIEECFRIMKSEFKSRPVYLSRDDRINAHFTTCFISLIIYRFLEKKLDFSFTCNEIINGLRDMNFKDIKGEGYEPLYTRNDFTDAIHNSFNFRTDYQILTKNKIKNILNNTKK